MAKFKVTNEFQLEGVLQTVGTELELTAEQAAEFPTCLEEVVGEAAPAAAADAAEQPPADSAPADAAV